LELRRAILDLPAAEGLPATRGVRIALDEWLTLVADANPERPPPLADDLDAADGDEAGLALRSVACPHCGEPVTLELELDGGAQEAVQDCAVCCRAIHLAWSGGEGSLERLDVTGE